MQARHEQTAQLPDLDGPMPPLLEITDLHTQIKMRSATVKAVDGASLRIRAGETVGLVGESGCGKTMTGMSILRLLPKGGHIVGGSIALEGRELTSLDQPAMRAIRGRDIGMVFQDPMTTLNPTMTIGNQVAEPVVVHLGASRREARDRATEVLELVGLPEPRERLNAFPHQLSGGLRQRVAIAMALACEPKLLIADEPTTALDVTIQAQILNLLDDLKSRLNMGLLLITHDLGVVAAHADNVFVMYAGQMVETGDTNSIFLNMRHPYTEALLDSIPPMDVTQRTALYSIPGAPPDLADPPTFCRFAPRCRYASDTCREKSPDLTRDDDGHAYACFFPVGKRSGDARRGLAVRADHASTGEGSQPSSERDAANVLLAFTDVAKEFPITKGVLRRKVGSVKAVSGVSFSVGRGEIFGLVGESGCGKTTVARIIAGLEQPDSGSIRLDGTDVVAMPRAARRRRSADIQLIFQDAYASLDPRMRIHSTLREPMAAQHIGSKAEREERIRSVLEEVGLPRRALELYPHEFSGGQRQRIGLARALTLDPRLIVADEPVSALDVSIQAQILNLMRRLQRERDLTYIVISHDLAVVRFLADRVGVMYLGKLVELGPVDDVYERPAHPYTAGLLAAIPVPDPTKARGPTEHTLKGELPSPANPPSGCRFRTRCPLARDICAVEEPVARAFGSLDHQAACHFPLQAPLGNTPATDIAVDA